ncbi:MAG: glycoside hydrolase family 25 protein [Kofleriaceae bacterium]
MRIKRAITAFLVAGLLLASAIWIAARDDRALMSPSCAGDTVAGIDVSYHQDRVDWARVRRAGIRFAFIRVSDGATFVDPRFAQHWIEAEYAHVLRGAYQYFRPAEDPIAQADLMIAALARDRGELPPAIDVEETGGKRPAQVAAAVRAWVDRVRAKLGVEPIVYVSPEFWRDRVGSADLSKLPLWIAHYDTDCPRVPKPWVHWTFWQHTKTGRVPGIRGNVDLDVFAGTLDELRARYATSTARR